MAYFSLIVTPTVQALSLDAFMDYDKFKHS